MICPKCKCEYIRGVTQCADCGVALVDGLDAATPASIEDSAVVSVWSGDDPADCAAVKEALTKADIPFVDQSSEAYFILRSTRPKTEIFVRAGDAERAGEILREMPGSIDFDKLTPEEIASLALPETDGDSPEDHTTIQGEIPPGWAENGIEAEDDGEVASEVWTGADEDMAEILASCLRENGIPSRKAAQGNRWSLGVPPELLDRAKEIVREVVDASPPE